MPRREPRTSQTQDRIRTAALEEFGKRGYTMVSIDEIVHRAGVTKGAFYYYYRDKRDLAADLHRQLWTRLRRTAAEAYDPTLDALTNIRRTFHAFYAALRNVEEARFFLRDAWSIPDAVAARAILDEWIGQTARFLRAAMESGQIVRVDPEVLASVLIGAFSEATLQVLTSPRIEETNEVLDRVVESFRVTPLGVDDQAPALPTSRR